MDVEDDNIIITANVVTLQCIGRQMLMMTMISHRWYFHDDDDDVTIKVNDDEDDVTWMRC